MMRILRSIQITLLILLNIVPGNSSSCDMIYDGICYGFFYGTTDYSSASLKCAEEKGRLVIIKNDNQSEALANHYIKRFQHHFSSASSFNIWIGLRVENDKYVYSDGSPLLSSNYSKWASNSVTPSQNAKVYMNIFTRIWNNDYYQNYKSGYICEYLGDNCNVSNITIPNAEYDFCHTNTSVEPGTKLSVRCLKGFHLQGANYTRCTFNATWTDLPQCVAGCPTPPIIHHAKLIAGSNESYVGDSATYICDDDYRSSKDIRHSHVTIYCEEDSTWTSVSCIERQPYTVEEIVLDSSKSAQLQCTGDISITEYHVWLWLRNSENVENINIEEDAGSEEGITAAANKILYSVDSNGTLTIHEANEFTVGLYVCFAVGNQTIPGNVIYNVKLSDACSALKGMERNEGRFVKENDSLLLHCPHDKRFYSFLWYKNNVELNNTHNVTIFPDGSLFIPTLNVHHEGNYACKIYSKFLNCATYIYMKVVVNASVDSACGYQTDPNHHPWTVSLWWKDETLPFCYGVYISEAWILTTSQCLSGVFRKKAFDIFVRFHLKSNDHSSSVRDIPVALVKMHPQFSRRLYVNDIGLVKLKENMYFYNGIIPICLPPFDFADRNPCDQNSLLKGTVTGWGSLEKDSIEPSVKDESMQLLSNPRCEQCQCETYSEKVFCAEKVNDTLPTYAGDAGSPFVVKFKGRMYLMGIYSWGERLPQLGRFDYYTKITTYIPWIENFTKL